MEEKIINNQNFQNTISIIIPSRKIDYLLRKSIDKTRELYKDIHIIVIIDENINTSKQYNDITILKSSNTNMSAKRNLGVKYSDKKYIAFIDSDAYPKNGWLENGISFMEQNENYSAVTGLQFNDPDDTFEQKCLRLLHYSKLICHKEWTEIIDKKSKIHDSKVFSSSNVILKREVYLQLKGMNEDLYLAEDNEFSERFSKNNYKIKFIPEVAVYHREGKLFSFLKKGYAMSYYYSNMLIKGKNIKTLKQTIEQLLPFIGFVIYILLLLVIYIKNINYYILLLLPIIPLFFLTKESFILSLKLQEKKINGFIFMFISFCLFSCIWIIGTFLGLINFPTDIKNFYRHN